MEKKELEEITISMGQTIEAVRAIHQAMNLLLEDLSWKCELLTRSAGIPPETDQP